MCVTQNNWKFKEPIFFLIIPVKLLWVHTTKQSILAVNVILSIDNKCNMSFSMLWDTGQHREKCKLKERAVSV